MFSAWHDEPLPAVLRADNRIVLTLAPATDAAKALTAEVVAQVVQHSGLKRPIGGKGLATRTRHVGMILGGLLRAAAKGRVVSAQQRNGGDMWDKTRGALIGRDAFWTAANAMHAAGLVGIKAGVQTSFEFDPASPAFAGLPAKLWPTPCLADMAHGHGLRPTGAFKDWRISAEAEEQRIVRDAKRGVVVRPLDETRRRSGSRQVIRRRPTADASTTLPPDQLPALEIISTDVEAHNAQLAAADIRGCRAPVLHRSFGSDLRLGGRFYSLGRDGYVNMPKAERAHITINGEPTVEVDMHAAFLTIFLALTGARDLPDGDLYERLGLCPAIPRDTVKAWFVQTFTPGKLVVKWAKKTEAEHRRFSVKTIREAAVRTYPPLSDMRAILPPDLAMTLPANKLDWAVGQYLVNTESRIMAGALGYLRRQGVVALPVHDSVIVPRSEIGEAKHGLNGACFTTLDIMPRLKP